jgi:hypothetical protein
MLLGVNLFSTGGRSSSSLLDGLRDEDDDGDGERVMRESLENVFFLIIGTARNVSRSSRGMW